jgi:hypothetical protein
MIRFHAFSGVRARDRSAIRCVDEESEDAQHYELVMLHYLAGAITLCVADLN